MERALGMILIAVIALYLLVKVAESLQALN